MNRNWATSVLLLFVLLVFRLSLFAEFYTPLRCSFLPLCKEHFDNDIATKMTWMESCGSDFIAPLKKYLKHIPKPYDADCYGCSDCGGVRFDLYNDFDPPVDDEYFTEIREGHKYIRYNRDHDCRSTHKHCEHMCWDGGYFRKWNHKFSLFFKHFLQYSDENPSCSCYWPEKNLRAARINDEVYEFIKDLCNDGYIDPSFSPYWIAKRIKYDLNGRFYGKEYYPNSHGMASSLTTYSFFYSQYRQTLLSIASFIDSNSITGNSWVLDTVYSLLDNNRQSFLTLYNQCLKKHPHSKIYYERGMVYLHSGRSEEALNDIQKLMQLAQDSEHLLTSEIYQQEGEAYADLGMYDNAIISLTEALKKDPGNKDAYFQRAHAYFESGNFEQAFQDYLHSGKSAELQNVKKATSDEFTNALLAGLSEGAIESTTEFFPSLWYSTCGLTEAIWVTAQHPVDATTNFCNACYEIAELTANYLRLLDWERIEGYSDDFKEVCERFNRLNDAEKGQKIGYLVGKFGVDIFAGTTTFKGIAALKKLKNANKYCNLEAMASSHTNKKAILSNAARHAEQRGQYFKNVKIEWDKQNKHVVGSKNYLEGKSIFEHPNANILLRKHAGKGRSCRGTIGNPGYQEVVNFNECIGMWISDDVGIAPIKTNWGKIHYSKNGAHIVPFKPKN